MKLKNNLLTIIFYIGCITILSIYIYYSDETVYIRQGINMLYNNKCNTYSQRILGFIFMDNPICRIYNRLYTELSRILQHDFIPLYYWLNKTYYLIDKIVLLFKGS